MGLEGKLLGGRYEILEKIGNGGMATVYKAKCHVLKRFVAVKILRDEFTTDNEFIKRFNVEAESAASLTHQNIVSVYDVGREENLYYIVMELVKGKTLKEIIIEEGKLPWKWAVKIAMQIASALEIAHRNNIIHRDIKPHNIIITEEGVAKVTDFGIAKAVSNSTITAFGTTIGSVHYFSPEHAKGSNTDAKSDIYSLGVVLYEMVTGKVPFDSDTPVSVALKHMQEEPIEASQINPDVPVMVNEIIKKAMKKEPSLRYQNATEMLRDLEKALKTPSATISDINQKDIYATQRISLNYNKKQETDNKSKKGFIAKTKDFFEKHKSLKIVAIILALILVFALSMFGTYLVLNTRKTVDIVLPDLSGLTLEEAERKVEELGLKVEVSEEAYDAEIEEGKIISQEPKYQENYTVKENSTIKVKISLGKQMVIAEKYVGLTRDEARDLAKTNNLELVFEEKNDDEVEKGIIIKQDIEEGKEVLAGSKITLTVSMGIEQVEVPDLKGLSEEEAKVAITKAKLKWKSTIKVSDSSKENGKVIEQSISAKSVVDKDTEITITVNEFDEVKSATIIVNVKSLLNYTPTYTEEGELIPAEKAELKIIVGDDIVYKEKISKDSTNIKTTASGTGTVTVKVYIDDVLKDKKSLNFNTTQSLTIE